MSKLVYSLTHSNNKITLFFEAKNLYSSEWFMDFGKFGADVVGAEDQKLYGIVKKFQFWKWKIVHTITNNFGKTYTFTSKNNRKTIYSILMDDVAYELHIHYKKRISIFKNNLKIAEFDESFSDKNDTENIKLFLLDKNDLEIVFLLYSCLKIGETNEHKKAMLTSQKQLETNQEPWS